MESCPHCHFLMRDDAVECGVCHRPRIFVATEGLSVVDDVRVGAGRPSGVPVALLAMLMIVLVIGAGVVAATQHWV